MGIRKFIYFIFLFTLTMVQANESNASFADMLTPQEKAYLKDHPVITVHNEPNWPPLNYNDNGNPKGFSVEYMNLLAKKIGLKVKYVSGYSWGEFVHLLHTNKLDLLINMSITKDREETIAFSYPFIQTKNAIYININGQPYYSLKDLEGKKVALVKDFFIQKYISKHNPGIKQVLVQDLLKALELLSLGKVDAVVGKQVVVDYLMRENMISSVIATDYINDPGTVSKLAIAADKKDRVLIEILKKAQQSMDKNTLSRLKHKWFGINALLDTKELLTDDEKDYLKSKHIIRVCTHSNNPPIEFTTGNKPKGIAIDILNTITNKLGVELQYIWSKSHQASKELLREDKCDIIPASAKTYAFSRYALFTDPYLSFRTALITQKDKPDINLLSEAKNKIIAGCKGDPIVERIIETHPYLVPYKTDTKLKAITAVQKGYAYLAAMPLPVYEYHRKVSNLKDIKIAGYAPIKSECSIAVRKSDQKLFTILNKIVRATPKVAYKAIADRWTKETIVEKTNYTLLFEMLGAALLVIGVVLLAYRKQQRLNKEIEKLNLTLESRIQKALEENKKQQMLMLHQDRLARMGEMIAMIAHQWRQPLNNLSLVNQLLISKYNKGKLDDEEIESFKTNSQKQIRQMSETIDDFRNFYQPKKEKSLFDLKDLVDETIKFVAPSYAQKKIDVDFEAKGSFMIYGYGNELQHAILNIMNNSADALIENDIKHKKIKIRIKKDGSDIVLEIADNGGGVDPDIQDRIFDPYFSTKEEKNGTGLGLYMTKVIISEHFGSDLDFYNSKEGAVFVIRLKEENIKAP